LSVELYETFRAEISQGDIFELLPHVFLDGPLLALEHETETILKAIGEPYREFNDKDGQPIVATCKRSKGILLSHDCEIDKPQVRKRLICPVVPLSRLRPQNQDRVKRNRIYSMLHLPKYGTSLEESFVDFNSVATIDAEFLRGKNRIVSLSDIGRRALYVQLIRWFSRWELREIVCPRCSASFDPHSDMQVRAE